MFQDKLGLALSGGGIKAYVQIPFIEFLVSNQIKISSISGTSMGSVIAALYACGATPKEIKNDLILLEKYFIDSKIFLKPNRRVLPFAKNKLDGFVNGDEMEAKLEEVFGKYGVRNINDVKIPLVIATVDLITGKSVLFVSDKTLIGPSKDWIIESDALLAMAVRSSCTLPVIFSSKSYKNMRLVDGGVLMNLPVRPLRDSGIKKIISVSMVDDDPEEINGSIITTAVRSLEIFTHASVRVAVIDSNYNFNVSLPKFNMLDIGVMDEVMEIASKQIDEDKTKILSAIKKMIKTGG